MPKRNISARKKLSALYVKGAEVRFGPDGPSRGPFENDPGEDDVVVWVQPPSPLQREMALREAQAARSRSVLTAKRDPDSEEALTARAFIIDMDDNTLIEYSIMVEEEEHRREAMRDIMGKEEWEDLPALQDAMRQWDEAGADEDDEEFAALLDRDAEFGRQVTERMKEIQAAAREVLRNTPREALETRAFKRRAEMAGSQSFMRTYERYMLFYACRDPEAKTELFFESVAEMGDLQEQVTQALADTLAEFIADAGEARNLPEAAPGSDSSVPRSEQETSEASTPETATA